MEQVPVIDLSSYNNNGGGDDDEERLLLLVQAIAQACSTYGFFQVIGHGIPTDLLHEFRSEGMAYFKAKLLHDDDDNDRGSDRRHETNARGFFDDELTQQKRDWKMAFDVGVPGSRDWNKPDDDPSNTCLDGYNQFPPSNNNDCLRDVVVRYFAACTELSDRLARLMAQGIVGAENDTGLVDDLRRRHTSYLRLNYYPPCDKDNELGISPHRDAGFLTVLLQDDDCHSLQVWYQDEWHTVSPRPGALTINTGDMAQIWSNGIYTAPLHRVLTNTLLERFSAPYFYNPGYDTYVAPVVATTTTAATVTVGANDPHQGNSSSSEVEQQQQQAQAKYHPCLWGYFRALRFAGDLTDLGVEIQVSDYEIGAEEEEQQQPVVSLHLQRQAVIAKHLKWNEPFSVTRLRTLIEESSLSSSLSTTDDI
jgi:isopenicillin N synthase-like dioxygenase